MVEAINGYRQVPKEIVNKPPDQQVKTGANLGEELDLLSLHFSDTREYQFDPKKNKAYAKDIFKGQISLLQLELLLTSGLLNPLQAEQAQKVLQEPRATFLIEEIKRKISNKKTSETMRVVRGRFLRRVALNQELFERRLTRIQEGESSTETQIQEIIESRTIIYHKSTLAFDNLVLTNLRLASSIANKNVDHGLELEDLIEHGYEGLMKAAARYDYRSGFEFSTYATWWVRQAVMRAVADLGNSIRIPVHIGENSRKLLRMRDSLTEELRRNPTTEELSERLGPGHEAAIKTLPMMHVTSLNRQINNSNETGIAPELGDLLVDDSPEPIEPAFATQRRKMISEALGNITDRERLVIEMRYGLAGETPMEYKAIGKKISRSRERVRQIEQIALGKLRDPKIAGRLRSLLQYE